jgi:hypothetical protein
MSLKNWVNNTFMVGISKVYHRSVFTIGLVAISMLNLLTTNSEPKRHPPNVLSDFSKVSEENKIVKN